MGRTARVWDRRGRLLTDLNGHHDVVTRCCFSADGSRVVTASKDGTARIWDVDNRDFPILRGRGGRVACAAFAPDRRRDVLTQTAGGTVCVWDLTGQRDEQTFTHPHRLKFCCYAPDGNRFMTVGGNDRSGVRVFERQRDGTFRADGLRYAEDSADALSSGTFFADGRRFLIVEWIGGQVRFHEVGREKPVDTVTIRGFLYCAAVSPDERCLLVGNDQKTVVLLARAKGGRYRKMGTVARHAGAVRGVSFSREGDMFLTASADKTARLWAFDGRIATEKTRFSGHEKEVRTAVFSPDGKHVLTASLDRTARIWDLDGNLVLTLRGHGGGVRSAYYSPDGREIVTASDDGTTRIWKASIDELKRLADAGAFRELTPEERRGYGHLLGD